jgi:hypothetical protein
VKESELNFGTVMLGHDNYQSLRVYNNGLAEGSVELEAPPPAPLAIAPSPSAAVAPAEALTFPDAGSATSLMPPTPASSSAAVHVPYPLSWRAREYFVPANGFLDIPVTFHPLHMAPLDTHLFVVSSGAGGAALQRKQRVKVKAYVGVPNLVVTPRDVLRNIDFGTCMTNQVHTREFFITNLGIIDVNFEIVFMRRKALEPATSAATSDGNGAAIIDRSETPPPLPGREDVVQPRRRKARLLDPPRDYVSAFAGMNQANGPVPASADVLGSAALVSTRNQLRSVTAADAKNQTV